MIIARSKDELAKHVKAMKSEGKTIGFVPTMGALHEGHLGLMDLAAKHADIVSVSIYVNPTQFAPHEDFDSYPRAIETDLSKLLVTGVGLVYLPQTEDIYPDGAAVTVKAGSAAQGLESDFRPHFFDGVTTVVHRLFEHMRPDMAVFGEKDFQQLQVIREMTKAENLGIRIIGGETARDEHGLALSSRNAYLSAEELETARLLNKVLAEATNANEAERQDMLEQGKAALLEAGFTKIDYLSFKPEWHRVLAAAWISKTRLIDNMATDSSYKDGQ